jgi:hypothetical protein
MKLTELTIRPQDSWSPVSDKNPLRAVVKIGTDKSVVECVLGDDTMRRLLDLCAMEIARSAERNIRDFVAAVTEIEGAKSAALIGGE